MGDERPVLLKFVLVGESRVGKTAMMRWFCEKTFNSIYRATIGADFGTRIIETNNTTVTAQLWDTAGNERFRPLVKAFYRGADGFVIVYDVTNRESFEEVGRSSV